MAFSELRCAPPPEGFLLHPSYLPRTLPPTAGHQRAMPYIIKKYEPGCPQKFSFVHPEINILLGPPPSGASSVTCDPCTHWCAHSLWFLTLLRSRNKAHMRRLCIDMQEESSRAPTIPTLSKTLKSHSTIASAIFSTFNSSQVSLS